MIQIVVSLGHSWMIPGISTIVLLNVGGKVNVGMWVYWGGCLGVGGVSESDMRGSEDDFLVSLGIFLFELGPLHFNVAVDGLVLLGCEVVAVGLLDFGVMNSFLVSVWSCLV